MDKDNQREDLIRTAYIAGLMDGEGTIRISKTKEYWGIKYQGHVAFTNTNKKAVEKVQKFLNLKSPTIHNSGDKGFKGTRPCYRVQSSGTKNIIRILNILLPFLEIKKRNAELVLKLLNEKKDNRQNKGFIRKKGGHHTSLEETQWRENIYQEYLDIVHPQRLTERTLERVK